jgi:DNA-binding NarL/FixJ family response regulator
MSIRRSPPQQLAQSSSAEAGPEERRLAALRLHEDIGQSLAASPAVAEEILARLRWLATLLRCPDFASEGRAPVRRLTVRQRQILRMIAEGRTTREMAVQLHLSVKTIESHRAKLMDQLGIRDIAGLVMYAIRSGVIDLYRGACVSGCKSGNA